MRGAVRFLLLALLLAALPLRGVAALALAQCEMHHGGVPLAQPAAHEHANDHDHAPDGTGEAEDSPPAASPTCSLCAGCCVGTPAAPDFARYFAADPRSLDRTPFVQAHGPGHVPDRLDRPPLPL